MAESGLGPIGESVTTCPWRAAALVSIPLPMPFDGQVPAR
jgi:hypothetical protein